MSTANYVSRGNVNYLVSAEYGLDGGYNVYSNEAVIYVSGGVNGLEQL